MSIKVRAIKPGVYGGTRRRVGAEFDITDEQHFSKKWMERVETKPQESKGTPGDGGGEQTETAQGKGGSGRQPDKK